MADLDCGWRGSVVRVCCRAQLKIMVQVQQLLDRKEALVQQLKTMNVEARALVRRHNRRAPTHSLWLMLPHPLCRLTLTPRC